MSEERAQEFVEENFGGGEEQVREGEEFGTENVREGEESAAENEFGGEEESFPVENDRGTTSEPSSSKRIKEMSIDRLSALPDSLLIHILSFLKMKEAAITSVLSKRWQFLWTELAWMIFWESSMESEKIRKFVAWVNRTLSVCSGNGLEGFVVEFQYQKSFASDVNVWVEFAVKNKVEELVLLLNSEEHYYTLPQMMYSNSSLTWLSLRGCILTTPQRTIEWRSLTSLFLNEVVLRQHVIEKILSSCPVLRTLFLRECWGFNCLRVNSRSLHELAVEYTDGYSERSLEISAPYIRSLDILQDPEERKLRLTNIPSVVKACINFNGLEWDATEEEVLTYTRELFEYLLHVKELELGCRYMEVLPLLVVNGWQLPQSRRGCLTVNASRDEQSISCIVSLLESSPNLETLVINGYDPYEASITSDPDARRDLDCDLLHLKTVHIENFADPKIGGEPLLTLAQILLKRATILEKMVIDVDKTTFSSRQASSDFNNIAQTLLSYPKSSPKAVVLLR